MLEELRIENFAIIEQLTLDFSEGFNVITGETGAGKSIIVDAMEMLVGGKTDLAYVRAGSDRAMVEATFALDDRLRAALLPILARELLVEPDEQPKFVTFSREIRASSNRSIARVNGTTVSAELLQELGEVLVDIHGQSAHLSLLRPRAHLDLLDRYADLLEVRSALGQVVHTLNGIRSEIHTLVTDKEALERRARRLRDEVEEIAAAELTPGEVDSLQNERDRLANSEQLTTLANEANSLLMGDGDDETAAAVDQLMQVAQVLAKLSRIDKSLADDYALAEDISTNVQELGRTIGRYADDLEHDPARLDEIEERLELIKTLKRRYKVDTIEDLLAYSAKAEAELIGLENSDEHLEELRKTEEKTLRHIGELAQRIHKVREFAGRNLSRRVVRELRDLRMENTRFEVIIQNTEDDEDGCYIDDKRYAFDSTGIDDLEFMMSANPGEPLRPLAKVASGGESARIMLALKRVLSQADETPILIFDEIDQGIGGRIGAVVGEKLWSLSNRHQVMAVTHLPQLASFADKHYHVRKKVTNKRTQTVVTNLDNDDTRVAELAEMLGALGETGKMSAREILEAARGRKHDLTAEPG
ncbi:MAG: DNA repair protein RecN [Anaerolineaceae bacterium]|nr:DNA repair protein RecN [Anaerolineaceae bacterium]